MRAGFDFYAKCFLAMATSTVMVSTFASIV